MYITTGSALTKKFAVQHKRPFLHIDLDIELEPTTTIKAWIQENNIQVLNVAGRSASKAPGIYEHVKAIICEIL